MTTRVLCALGFAVACATLSLARPDDKSSSDQQFVTKAGEGGLAEVNLGNLAAKRASDSAVKKFAEHMVKDHTKANKELDSLGDSRKFTLPKTMDAEHKKMMDKLGKLSGAEFDRAYMEGQVKDHEETVALFEKEAKNGKDEELRGWAKKTLPTLRMHLKMARETYKNLGGKERRR